MKKKVVMYLLGLILMGMGFLCYFYRKFEIVGLGSLLYRELFLGPLYEWVYPYRTLGIPLIFVGIAIFVIWLLLDVLGKLDKT